MSRDTSRLLPKRPQIFQYKCRRKTKTMRTQNSKRLGKHWDSPPSSRNECPTSQIRHLDVSPYFPNSNLLWSAMTRYRTGPVATFHPLTRIPAPAEITCNSRSVPYIERLRGARAESGWYLLPAADGFNLPSAATTTMCVIAVRPSQNKTGTRLFLIDAYLQLNASGQ